MGYNTAKTVWVGVTAGVDRIEVSTNLKGLSELMGVGYLVVKRKAAERDSFVVLSEGTGEKELVLWTVKRVEVKKVRGRGDSDLGRRNSGGGDF